MFNFEVKNSNGQVILNSKNKLAKLKEEINHTVPKRTVDDYNDNGVYGIPVNISPTTQNQIFIVHSSENFLVFVNKLTRENGYYNGFTYLTNANAGSTISFYVYEIEEE